jgi:drug/metabolite transporter (DMT)-like permease
MNNKQPPISPLLAIAFALLAVSTASIFIRYAQSDATSLVIAAGRLTVASIVLLPIAWTHHRAELAGLTRKQWLLSLLSGVFLAVHFATWISSLEYTTVASSAVLVSTTPLWVAVFTPIFLKEKVRPGVVMGMAVALVGGLTIGLSDMCTLTGGRLVCPDLDTLSQGEAFLGNLLALAGALAATGYFLIGRRLRERMSLVSYVSVVYAMAAIVLIGWMFAAGQKPWGLPPRTYLWIVLLGLVPQLIGHSTFNWALGYLSAAFVSITLLGEPIGSTILAMILLDEVPSILKIIGGVLILAGIYLSARSPAPVSADQPPPAR